MEVIATKKGYYGGKIREPGDQFTIESERAYSERWMKRAETKPSPTAESAARSGKASKSTKIGSGDAAPRHPGSSSS